MYNEKDVANLNISNQQPASSNPIEVSPGSFATKKFKVILIFLGILLTLLVGSLVFNRTLGVKTDISHYYATDKIGVYYKNDQSAPIIGIGSPSYIRISGADKDTFTVIDNYYAKDKNHVYLEGLPVPGADPETFVYLGDKASYDANWYYYEKEKTHEKSSYASETELVRTHQNNGKNIKPKVENELQIFPTEVFYYGKKLAQVDASTFHKYNGCYYEDKNYLIWHCYSLVDPVFILKDKSSPYRELGEYETSLKNNNMVVIYGKVLADVNAAIFDFVKNFDGTSADPLGSDGKFVFFKNDKVSGVDLNTFEPIPCTKSYFKDKNRIYRKSQKSFLPLAGLDASSFVYNFDFIADRNGVYKDVSGKLELINSDSRNFKAIVYNNGRCE